MSVLTTSKYIVVVGEEVDPDEGDHDLDVTEFHVMLNESFSFGNHIQIRRIYTEPEGGPNYDSEFESSMSPLTFPVYLAEALAEAIIKTLRESKLREARARESRKIP